MRKGLFALLTLLFLLASCNRVTRPREEMPEGILYQDDF